MIETLRIRRHLRALRVDVLFHPHLERAQLGTWITQRRPPSSICAWSNASRIEQTQGPVPSTL
jgi:hypothetical protein